MTEPAAQGPPSGPPAGSCTCPPSPPRGHQDRRRRRQTAAHPPRLPRRDPGCRAAESTPAAAAPGGCWRPLSPHAGGSGDSWLHCGARRPTCHRRCATGSARCVDAGHPVVLLGDLRHRQAPSADRPGRGRLPARPAGAVCHHRRPGRRTGPWPPANASWLLPWPATAPCDLLCLDELGYLHLDSHGAELLLAGPDRTPRRRLPIAVAPQRTLQRVGPDLPPTPAWPPRSSTG
jgi:hypothetical protein